MYGIHVSGTVGRVVNFFFFYDIKECNALEF